MQYIKLIQISALNILLLSSSICRAQQDELPFKVDSLFDQLNPASLGLEFAPKVESITIFEPDSSENKYNHGVVLFPFKGMLYAQWQSSAVDEDGEDTQVLYSKSIDGKRWSKPQVLSEKSNEGMYTSGGWWKQADTLIAYLNFWPKNSVPKGGYTRYRSSYNGIDWSSTQAVTDIHDKAIQGIIEQDVQALPSGRIITAFHLQPGLLVQPYFTDHASGTRNWKAAKFERLPSNKTEISREIEPSWFYRKDGAVVMIFRDQHNSYKKLASVSKDEGESWSKPILINTPDSRAKQSAGNLPNGTAYMVNNPTGSKSRIPLVITLSRDGFLFDKAYLIRRGGKDLQNMRYQGRYKRVGYSYPKSVVWGNYLYIGYATNKEDVELSRIPIEELQY